MNSNRFLLDAAKHALEMASKTEGRARLEWLAQARALSAKAAGNLELEIAELHVTGKDI